MRNQDNKKTTSKNKKTQVNKSSQAKKNTQANKNTQAKKRTQTNKNTHVNKNTQAKKNTKSNRKKQDINKQQNNSRKKTSINYQNVINPEDNIAVKDNSKTIINIAYIIIGLFVLVIAYFAFFMFTKSEDVVNNPYNKRQDLLAEQIVRGSIISADGKTLAHTVQNDDGSETRIYPYGDVFAHSVGRLSKGRTGIELSENFRLLTSNTNGLKQIFMDLTGQKNLGDSVVTTLDYNLQQAAYDGLGSSKGAIVVMEPSSGKILALVSKPDYDPNNIDNIWDNVKDDNTDNPLMNRATMEAYPPGSIFKVVTALEFMRQDPNYESYTYDCNGTFIGESGDKITCVRPHGTVNLKDSLAVSCNSSFANIAENLDPAKFKDTAENLGLKNLPGDLDYNHPFTSIGQGDVKVTPMQMAQLTSAIANGGVSMKPYITDYIINSDGNTIKKFSPEINANYTSTEEAAVLTEYMAEVINSGTATSLQSDRYTASGKTGTAQNLTGSLSHSWFIGFANTDNPEIAVSIIVENASPNSKHAVPIAKDIFNTYFSSK